MIYSSRCLIKAKNHIQTSKLPYLFTKTLSSSSSINVDSALRILQLQDKKYNYTPYDLRDAYFAAAKFCHPDSNKNATLSQDESTIQFLQVTEAYEILQTDTRTRTGKGGKSKLNTEKDDDDHNNPFVIQKSAEEEYRTACREFLGLDAETVEESKRCPLFREWLKGNTDAVFHWNRFFMVNGGLAPMLNRKRVLKLSDGDDGSGSNSNGSRRRRRRSHSKR